MTIIAILILLVIVFYTLGFGITIWKDKQKMGAVVVFFLTLLLIILPFFSILK